MIGAFKDIEAAGDKIFGNLEVAAANAAWIGGLIAGLFGAGVAAGTYGVELWIDQQQFDHTLDDVIGRLQGLDYAYNHGQAAWVQNARFMVQTDYSGCLGCAPAGFEDVSVSVQTWILDPPHISA